MSEKQSIKICACGCGEPVRSPKVTARYRRGHRARSQFGTPWHRFWANVIKKADGCWLWKQAPGRQWYGELHVFGQKMLAHRFSWELHNGPIPDSLYVLHRCDTPQCVRPDHLFLGTNADNMQDKIAKGRQSRGETHGMSRLSSVEVDAIRNLHKSGVPVTKLASAYGVCPDTVYRIVRGKLWKHLLGKE